MRTDEEEVDRIEENNFFSFIPKTLMVNPGGEPLRWISYQKYAYYKSKNSIAWSLGKKSYVLRGGINAKTMQRSTLEVDGIIAVKNNTGKRRKGTKINLNNTALFNRDGNRCAYCYNVFKRDDLTRDHIVPLSKGGPDHWDNVVTCCFRCNQKKSNKMLADTEMKLMFKPYTPSHHEKLIFENRNITDEQLDYLIVGVSPHSRVYKEYLNRKNNGEDVNAAA